MKDKTAKNEIIDKLRLLYDKYVYTPAKKNKPKTNKVKKTNMTEV